MSNTIVQQNMEMMRELISQFPKQLSADFLSDLNTLNHVTYEVQNICVAGMGGSGIGADYVQNFIRNHSQVPLVSNKTDTIPAYVNEHTLFIASSYSGNTVETLNCLYQAKSKGAQVVCVTSGGQMMDFAKANNIPLVKIPAGLPIPRAGLGYSIMALLYILERHKLIKQQLLDEVKACSSFLINAEEGIKQSASSIVNKVSNRLLVCYAGDQYTPVLLRQRQQLNENAKTLCSHKPLPEMNHNEIVGWTQSVANLAVLFYRGNTEREETTKRLDLTLALLREKTEKLIEIVAIGDNLIEQSFYLTSLSDWISYYLAKYKGVDPMEIDMINQIKKAL